MERMESLRIKAELSSERHYLSNVFCSLKHIGAKFMDNGPTGPKCH